MESLFFNITDRRYKVSTLFDHPNEFVRRIDISNGVLFFHLQLLTHAYRLPIKNFDRMVMIVLIKEGNLSIVDKLSDQTITLKAGETGLYTSSRQEMILHTTKKRTDVLILFVADFFLKRYLSGSAHEAIDFLYHKIQGEGLMEEVDRQPIDALTLYIVEKLLSIQPQEQMQSIRAEHRVVEWMIHRFSLLDIVDEKLSFEDLTLARRAKTILLKDYVTPPTIKQLAHLCATNESKLKRVFKEVYQTTLHSYVQKLRLEQANLLLKEESLTIGAIAKRVGYKHQGYFSKLFYQAYGVYPMALLRG